MSMESHEYKKGQGQRRGGVIRGISAWTLDRLGRNNKEDRRKVTEQDIFNRRWLLMQQEQLEGKERCGYCPVGQAALEQSANSYDAPYRSFGFYNLIPAYRDKEATIIYLHGSARAMLLFDKINYGFMGPSEVFDCVGSDLLAILDGSISEIPTDLLVLSGNYLVGSNELRDCSAALSCCRDLECVNNHSLVQYQGRLIREHVERIGRGNFAAFSHAWNALRCRIPSGSMAVS